MSLTDTLLEKGRFVWRRRANREPTAIDAVIAKPYCFSPGEWIEIEAFDYHSLIRRPI